MKFIIFAGTPGSGKTSLIKNVVKELGKSQQLFFAKFDCLRTDDNEKITQEHGVPAVKKLAEELCPDHYTALEIPGIIQKNPDKDIVLIETAGLCLRCSPYVNEGLGINVLDILSGHPNRYGPILTDADIVAVSKSDLISQAEREIFRHNILVANPGCKIVEVNGLTGEGAAEIAELIRNSVDIDGKKLTLKNSTPSAVCGYCYGNKIIDDQAVRDHYLKGKELKNLLPNLNCGRCGFKSCNEFIRAVLSDEVEKEKCPFVKLPTS